MRLASLPGFEGVMSAAIQSRLVIAAAKPPVTTQTARTAKFPGGSPWKTEFDAAVFYGNSSDSVDSPHRYVPTLIERRSIRR
jgi:hypothetical protein